MSATTMLPSVMGADLPRLVHAHGPEHNPVLTEPQHFRPITAGPSFVKPVGVGLWTSPVTESSPGGEPVRTAWTDWCRDEACFDADTYVRFVEIVPAPDARVLRIDTLADLRTVVAAFPADPFYPGQRQEYPDWHAMAAAGWDAVWLTDDGQRATPYGEPNLYGWDCESVLWLHPAYSCKEVAR